MEEALARGQGKPRSKAITVAQEEEVGELADRKQEMAGRQSSEAGGGGRRGSILGWSNRDHKQGKQGREGGREGERGNNKTRGK